MQKSFLKWNIPIPIIITHIAIGEILIYLEKYEILPHTNNYFGKVTPFNFPICKIGKMTLPYLTPYDLYWDSNERMYIVVFSKYLLMAIICQELF